MLSNDTAAYDAFCEASAPSDSFTPTSPSGLTLALGRDAEVDTVVVGPFEGSASEITAQTSLALDYSADVETAFDDGRLSIIVDDERTLQWHLSFVARPEKWDCRGSIVHVVSKPAGGEIRGYVLINGTLHLRLPNYAGDWPELDAAVERLLGAKVVR